MAVAIFSPLTQFFDNNGDPLNGGTVTVQDAGTTSSRNIYTDTALTVAATNPVPLDSAGRPTQGVIYTAATAYKLILKNSAGSTIRTEDNLDPGVPVGSGVLAITNGGTGGATASAARAALGAVGTSDIEDLEADVAALVGASASSEKTQIAVGTTAQRPASPAVGNIRVNTTTSKFELVRTGTSFENAITEANTASTANVSGESSSEVYVKPSRMKYHPGIAKAWARITISGGTPAYTDSWGFDTGTAITDTGDGDWTFTLSTAMANANYVCIATAHATSDVRVAHVHTLTTTTIRIRVSNASGTGSDPAALSLIVFGDL